MDGARGESQRQMHLYEVIGTHFVDIFFNHIYDKAKKGAERGAERSITSAFQRDVATYVGAVQNQSAAFRRTAVRLQEYTQTYIPMGINNYTTFVDRVVVTLIPERYFESLTPAQKDEVFAGMICNLVAGLGVYTTKPGNLGKIIDQRSGSAASKVLVDLQNHAKTLLHGERERLHNQFLGVSSKAKDVGAVELIVKLKGALKEMAAKAAEAEEALHATQSEGEKWRLKYKQLKLKHRELLGRLAGFTAPVAPVAPAAPVAAGASAAPYGHPGYQQQPPGPPPSAGVQPMSAPGGWEFSPSAPRPGDREHDDRAETSPAEGESSEEESDDDADGAPGSPAAARVVTDASATPGPPWGH